MFDTQFVFESEEPASSLLWAARALFTNPDFNCSLLNGHICAKAPPSNLQEGREDHILHEEQNNFSTSYNQGIIKS